MVLFTQRVEIVESYGERRDCADQRIAGFIKDCGFLPVPVPNQPEIAKGIVKELPVAGIILTGGNSLVKYGGNASERDDTDRELICVAIEKGIPLYGFCRGMQSILDYFGNELGNVKGHVAVRHQIVGREHTAEVNSYHNQACQILSSDELQVIMQAQDGAIEKISHKSLPIIGTMWHPERENPFRKMDVEMIKNLFGGENESNHTCGRTGNENKEIHTGLTKRHAVL